MSKDNIFVGIIVGLAVLYCLVSLWRALAKFRRSAKTGSDETTSSCTSSCDGDCGGCKKGAK